MYPIRKPSTNVTEPTKNLLGGGGEYAFSASGVEAPRVSKPGRLKQRNPSVTCIVSMVSTYHTNPPNKITYPSVASTTNLPALSISLINTLYIEKTGVNFGMTI
jgi:hypothetical protein